MGWFLFICYPIELCSTGEIVLMFGSIIGTIVLTFCCGLARAKGGDEDRVRLVGLVGHMEEGEGSHCAAGTSQQSSASTPSSTLPSAARAPAAINSPNTKSMVRKYN